MPQSETVPAKSVSVPSERKNPDHCLVSDSLAGESVAGIDNVSNATDEGRPGDSEDSEDIVMPEGPPPEVEDHDAESISSEDSDGIVMPRGSPPNKPPIAPRAEVGIAKPGGHPANFQPPLPPGPAPPENFMFARPSGLRPPPMQQQPSWAPVPDHQGNAPQRWNPSGPWQGGRPSFPPPGAQSLSLRPQMAAPAPGPPPPRPSAVISAAPVLRDLKKEATAFVPPALRKRQAMAKAQAAKGGLPSAVNAAPGATTAPNSDTLSGAPSDHAGSPNPGKVDLMASLRPHMSVPHLPKSEGDALAAPAEKAAGDDYQRFLGEIGDLL